MKKRNVLILVVLVLCASLALQATGSAMGGDKSVPCYPAKGCTPGYWKQPQHLDSWTGYAPDDLVSTVFGAGPDITLLEALRLKGGVENKFLAHAVAGLLNAAHADVCYGGKYGNDWEVEWFVWATYTLYPESPFEMKKNMLEVLNEAGCPLD